MLNRFISILGTSPFIGSAYTTYHRRFSGMIKHTVFDSSKGIVSHGGFTVQPIPTLDDNYAYLIIDTATKSAALVDPAEPDIAIAALKEHDGVNITHVLTTHKHWDHAQGNGEVKRQFPHVEVVGGEIDHVTACTKQVKHGDKITIGKDTQVSVLFTPCHTKGHVLYHVTSSSSSVVFTGDTLFIAGAGKFFEGTAAQMHHALNTVIAGLPPTTSVYCGHEYTQSNLEFAAWAEPSNNVIKEKLKWAKERRENKESTLGTTVAEEQKINPFMRVNEPEIAQRVSRWIDKNIDGDDAVKVMHAVREAKNQNAHKQSASL